jgi:hypothetical protein
VFELDILTVKTVLLAERTTTLKGGPNVERELDMTPEGKQFVAVTAAGTPQSTVAPLSQLQVVLNWFTELQQRVPAK